MIKPRAALSFDLDNLWSYLKTHGDAGWVDYPSYLPRLLPPVLDWFAGRRLRLTFFVVGRDAARPENASALAALAPAGHEIGNHSLEHEPWLHTYPRRRIAAEIDAAEQAITAVTGVRPDGFRGPGFCWSPDLLEVLADRGYVYDASTLPTFLGPLGRAYYFARSRFEPEEKARRKGLFGGLSDGLRPSGPYVWALPSGRRLTEIPVTTIPVLKTPFHLSYLMYLARYSESLMSAYLRLALGACRRAGFGPSFLLHPLDFLGPEDAPGLAFFPGMDINKRKKMRLAGRVLDELAERFEIVPLGEYARGLAAGPRPLRVRPAGIVKTARAGGSS
ncbi:MAG: polysaccharide deacetylase family protein [Acidobacteriota bacterium]|nr:polysaccharide deacetylase family protein [Acidobacteriota bacterium]